MFICGFVGAVLVAVGAFSGVSRLSIFDDSPMNVPFVESDYVRSIIDTDIFLERITDKILSKSSGKLTLANSSITK